uniref:Putative Na(+)-translocating NADH-quinone reductase subunit A n=1 Tax=termite gut metagenome TaxID=433724 RepID=S0DDP9_9ZZZZ
MKLLVREGDRVKAGSPLFFDKANEEIIFTSPVSGVVEEVIKEEKGKLRHIVIKTDRGELMRLNISADQDL